MGRSGARTAVAALVAVQLLSCVVVAVRVPQPLAAAAEWVGARLPSSVRPPVPHWTAGNYPSELREPEGHTRPELVTSAVPSTYLDAQTIPAYFSWSSEFGGPNYLTRQLNQHVPWYCGSCWAHAALSSLGDRIKIARRARGFDVELSVQYLLNCAAGVAGSCHGGSFTGTYDFIQRTGMVPFDTCLAYESCSSDSTEGLCGDSSRDYSCSAFNTCRTCSTFAARGGFCAAISTFPNATVAEYGRVWGVTAMQAEIFARGPIACSLNAEPLHTYTGGVLRSDEPKVVNHAVSVYGWGTDPEEGPYWLVRNSWGQYWGEGGSFRIERGSDTLGLESRCAWATPGSWTESNTPCFEDGGNCVVQDRAGHWPEPAVTGIPHGVLAQRLQKATLSAEL
jgi:cathepsin X